jgi:ABC-type sugar transport system permease subunit
MYGLKLFDYVYVLTRGGPDNATSVAAYYIYLNYFTYFRVSYGAAISTLLTVGMFIISFIFMRIRMRYEQ